VWLTALLGGAFWLVLHLLAFLLLRHADLDALKTWTTPFVGGVLWFVLTLMLSHAILLSVAALFDRGDLDLLLSSPLPSRAVFVVRAAGIAISSVTLYAFFLLPLAHAGLVTGHANLMAIYPTLAAMAMMATAAGLMLTLVLVRLIGARRARTVAQVMGALTGAVIFLVMQAQNIAGTATQRRVLKQLIEWAKPGGPLAFDSSLWTFFHAATGRMLPLLAIMAVGAASFWLVVTLAHRRFVEGTQETVTGSARRIAPASSAHLRFRPGLVRTVLLKEWRLIMRDTQLIAQTLLQVLYLLPMVFIVFRRQDMLAMVVPSAVLLSGTLTGTLAWITVTAEEAPELVGVAPVPLVRIRWIKVVAAMLPVWLLVSPLFFFLLTKNVWHAAVFIFCLAGSTACGGMMQVWYPRQGDRRNMRKRMQSGKFVSVLEGFSGLGWAGVAWCLVAAPMFTPLPLLFAAVGPTAAWFLGESRREQGLLV
jgi:ABC-2 type transport system permease protein